MYENFILKWYKIFPDGLADGWKICESVKYETNEWKSVNGDGSENTGDNFEEVFSSDNNITICVSNLPVYCNHHIF